jgi:hypothetical protein
MTKNCVCIKNWNDYKIGDISTITKGSKLWFLGGVIISQSEFKGHFEIK